MRRSALVLLMLPALAACGSKTDTRLKAIEERLDKVEAAMGRHQAVTVKPGDKGYGLIETDVGRIAIAIAGVQAYGGGTRVILDFGNPTSARLSGMKAKIDWGANDSRGLPVANSAVQSLNFIAPEPLPAGSWHQYPIDLPGVAPTQLGWLRISGFDPGTVDLLNQ